MPGLNTRVLWKDGAHAGLNERADDLLLVNHSQKPERGVAHNVSVSAKCCVIAERHVILNHAVVRDMGAFHEITIVRNARRQARIG